MALDTRDKRASATGLLLPWRAMLPAPDGAAFDGGDRQQVAFLYRGISAGGAILTAGGDYIPTWRPRRR